MSADSVTLESDGTMVANIGQCLHEFRERKVPVTHWFDGRGKTTCKLRVLRREAAAAKVVQMQPLSGMPDF